MTCCRCLQACNRKRKGKHSKNGKNKQSPTHTEVVRLLLGAILKLRESPVTVEVKQTAQAGGGVTMGEGHE